MSWNKMLIAQSSEYGPAFLIPLKKSEYDDGIKASG